MAKQQPPTHSLSSPPVFSVSLHDIPYPFLSISSLPTAVIRGASSLQCQAILEPSKLT